jgi:cysteine desulfurase/selenocysteine lyase
MEFSALFPIRERCLYLDHAQKAPLPKPCTDAMAAALATLREGSFWQSRELSLADHQVRALISQVVGCHPADVSLFHHPLEAFFALVCGLPSAPRAAALVASEDQQALQRLGALLGRLGYEVQSVAPVRWRSAETLSAFGEGRFHLVLAPWVDELGWIVEPATLRQTLAPGGVLVLDATHGVPCRPESFYELGADALLLSSHTWLLGPPGVAALVSTQKLRRRWAPAFPSPRHPQLEDVADGACFDAPDLAAPALAGWAASLELLLAQGLAEVRTRIFAHQRTLTRTLVELGWEVLSPGAAHGVVGIVAAKHPFFPAQEVQRRLEEKHVRVGVLGDAVRFAPHFYTTIAELEALRQLLAKL